MRKWGKSLATTLLMGFPAWVVLAGLAAGGSASLVVRVAEPDVTVWVGDRPHPPGPIEVEPGEHLVRVTRGGQTLFSQRVRVEPGDRRDVLAGWASPAPTAAPSLGGDPTRVGHAGRVNDVEFGGGGRVALSADDAGVLRFWDPADGRAGRVVAANRGTIDRVAVFGDGRGAVSAARDGRLRLWDLADGSEARALPLAAPGRVTALAVTRDGRLAATGDEHTDVRVIELATGRELFLHRAARTMAGDLAFTPDGRLLVAGLVGPGGGPHPVDVLEVSTGRLVRRMTGHTGPVWGVGCLPDGRRAVTVGGDRTLRVWDLGDGRELKRMTGLPGAGRCLALAPDGRHALVGTGHRWAGGWTRADSYGVQLWDLDSGRCLGRFPTGAAVCSVAVSPDGRRLLAADEDRVVCSWEVPSPLADTVAPALSVGTAEPPAAGLLDPLATPPSSGSI